MTPSFSNGAVIMKMISSTSITSIYGTTLISAMSLRLRARGLKLAMITNGMAETHRDKIAILKLEAAFDEIFIADEVGMIKPDVRLFELAAARLGVAPNECAMVGDRLERDVRGARDAGMFTVWMNVREETVPPAGPHPDATVFSIVDVEAALPFARTGA